MSNNNRTRNVMSMDQRFEVQFAIKQHGRKTPDGYWEYDPEWSDERIAREFGISSHNVAHTRAMTFAKIRRAPVAPPDNGAHPQIKELQQEVSSLKSRVTELERNFTPRGGSSDQRVDGRLPDPEIPF